MPGPTLAVLTITDEEREVLERWLSRSKTSQALAMRARIVLAAAEGKSNSAVSREFAVNISTVRKWRRCYLELGPDGLLDEPRPGVPRTITDDQVEAVIVRTLETMPAVGTHWSTRAMGGGQRAEPE